MCGGFLVKHIVSTYSGCGGFVDNLLSLHKEGVVVSWIIYCHYIKKVWWFPG